MTRLIDADKAIEATWEQPTYTDPLNVLTEVRDRIRELPTVDAVPVRHGKWIKLDMHAHLADHKCTACGQECYVPTCMGDPMYIYCPNCGARMDEEKE